MSVKHTIIGYCRFAVNFSCFLHSSVFTIFSRHDRFIKNEMQFQTKGFGKGVFTEGVSEGRICYVIIVFIPLDMRSRPITIFNVKITIH